MPTAGEPPRKRLKITKRKSVLERVPLKVRLTILNHLVTIESIEYGFERDHLGRFICPVNKAGWPPYFKPGMITIEGLRLEYLGEVLKTVVFTFTTSNSLMEFSRVIRRNYNFDTRQIPFIDIKTSIFHDDAFPNADTLSMYKPTDTAHAEIVSLRDLNVEFHLCRPWRNFRSLRRETVLMSGYNVRVTYDASNWNEIPMEDGLRSFHIGMMRHSVTGEDLDAETAEFQKNMSQTTRYNLTLYGTRGFER